MRKTSPENFRGAILCGTVLFGAVLCGAVLSAPALWGAAQDDLDPAAPPAAEPNSAASPASGTVELRSGGTVPGTLAPYTAGALTGQRIELEEGLQVAISSAAISNIRGDDGRMAEYRRRLEGLPDEPAAHWELSQWCNGETLYAQKERHLRRVIELDPNHGPARAELGFIPVGNKWVQEDVYRRSRGMVRDQGKWRFAEEVLAAREFEAIDAQRKEWLKKLASLKVQAARGGPRGTDALAQLQGIQDPAADEAIVKELSQRKENDRFPRSLWFQTLARLRTPLSVQTLIRAGLEDPDDEVRAICYASLNEYGKYQAISFYLSRLRDADNTVVRQAGRALVEINDPEIALTLVDFLRTKHTYESAPGNDTNIGFARDSNGGLGGTQFGSKRVRIVKELDNPEVLSALLEVVGEDVNYQYDQNRWRVYFAQRIAPYPGDLRRDP